MSLRESVAETNYVAHMQQQVDIPRSRGGRPARGGRAAVAVRPGDDLKALYEERAAALGIPVGVWCIVQINEHLGLPLPEWVKEDLEHARHEREREELPLRIG